MRSASCPITVVGSVNRDTIYAVDGRVIESYGGILYSVLALSCLAGPEATISPVSNVGRDVAETVWSFLGGRPNIRLDGLTVVPDPNAHCILRYDAEGHKEETLIGGVPALTYGQIAPFLACDALCVNFISGFELALETMRAVRAGTPASILTDVHSLTLGIDERRRRFFRPLADWQEWLACTDIVQMNEWEAGALAGADLRADDDLLDFGTALLSVGPSALVVTRGERGSVTVFRQGGDVQMFATPACPFGPLVDPTGCGDVFLAGFALEYLRSRDPVRASAFANRAAGANCALKGMQELGRLGELVRGGRPLK